MISNPLLERRLREFVDRDHELMGFGSMLDSTEKPIMVVWGETGIGKTSLLMRMIHECATRKMRKAEVVWKDTSPHDYLAVMRKVRDDIGPEHFPAFTDLVNFYHEAGYQPKLQVTLALQGGSLNVGQGMSVSGGSVVRDVAGVVIKDSMFQFPRQDLAVQEVERRTQLTQRFIRELRSALQKEPLIVFLDAVEKMSSETTRWIWDELLDPVRTGVLTAIRFVLCGQTPPPNDRDWLAFITEAALKPLGPPDVSKYLQNRIADLDPASLNNLTTMLLANTGGNPAAVASQVDAFLKWRSK